MERIRYWIVIVVQIGSLSLFEHLLSSNLSQNGSWILNMILLDWRSSANWGTRPITPLSIIDFPELIQLFPIHEVPINLILGPLDGPIWSFPRSSFRLQRSIPNHLVFSPLSAVCSCFRAIGSSEILSWLVCKLLFSSQSSRFVSYILNGISQLDIIISWSNDTLETTVQGGVLSCCHSFTSFGLINTLR